MLLSESQQRAVAEAIPGVEYIGPIFRLGPIEVFAAREGEHLHVGAALQRVESKRILRPTLSTEALRKKISEALGAPFEPVPASLIDDEEYDAAIERGDLEQFLGWISATEIVALKKQFPELDIRRCNCCNAVLIDDDLCAVEIQRTRCGRIYISDWDYIIEGYSRPSDPILAAHHDIRGRKLAAQIAAATGLPLASRFGCP